MKTSEQDLINYFQLTDFPRQNIFRLNEAWKTSNNQYLSRNMQKHFPCRLLCALCWRMMNWCLLSKQRIFVDVFVFPRRRNIFRRSFFFHAETSPAVYTRRTTEKGDEFLFLFVSIEREIIYGWIRTNEDNIPCVIDRKWQGKSMKLFCFVWERKSS